MRSAFTMAVFLLAGIAARSTGAPGAAEAASDASRGLLLVVNKGEGTLGIVDPEAGRQVAAVPVGGVTGHEVAASPDGQTAWVPI